LQRTAPNLVLTAVLAAVACSSQTVRAQTQETWGGQGGASAWHAGTVPSPRLPNASVVTGSESSWTAGKGSIAEHSEPKGEWSENSTLRVGSSSAFASRLAAGSQGLARSGVMPLKTPSVAASFQGRTGARPGGLHSTTGTKGAFGPQFGPAKIGSGIPRPSFARSGATTHRSQLGTASHSSSTLSGEVPQMQLPSDSTLKDLNGSMPDETPGSELK
jgi:hypothetical protein